MSGAMPQALADAATGIAQHAQNLAIGRQIALNARENLARRQGVRAADSLAGHTWRTMHSRVRTLLVMLECQDAEGDPRTIALQPWGSFSAADQCRMGAAAREIGRELKRADYLR